MDFMNCWNVLKAPKPAVKDALEKGNFFVAAVLVLLPALVFALGAAVWGVLINPVNLAMVFGFSIAAWLVGSIVLFALMYVLKKGRERQSFKGIASSIALLEVPAIISTILILLVPLFVPTLPLMIGELNKFQQGTLSSTALTDSVSSILDTTEINTICIAILAIIVLVLFIVYLSAFYQTVKQSLKLSSIPSLVILLVLLFISAVIPIIKFGSLSSMLPMALVFGLIYFFPGI
jgi:hypothetical protein